MHPILFEIGPIKIYSYGFMMAVAFVLGIYLAVREGKRQGIGPDRIVDLSLVILVGGVLGAKILFLLLYPERWGYFLKHPLEFMRAGLVFYGGFIGAGMASLIYIRWRKMPLGKVADVVAPSVAIGLALGRVGCFLNGCCYGKITTVPWGVHFPWQDRINSTRALLDAFPYLRGQSGTLSVEMVRTALLHPTELYEFAYSLIIFLILMAFRRRMRYEGQVFLLYMVLYAVARFFNEFFRGDDRGLNFLGILSPSQFVAICAAAFALIAILAIQLRGKRARAE
ncbi:MAG: prolipoprotein diacylglyceryl transferase [bacterium]